ncbi:sigma-54-dependent Fis family transcriptional regulator [Pseudoalteromonas luteoviolacea]|uniref:sigma-54-dependent transcriptional regulator n=1 Tax=Pseudoalteromonas luteoviolacea TaxID=43657 RepID=UPI001B3A7531|nr:sigma-54 dependent transcriptional regulator [Pseudoalteromonas luteoviolacea]MBQ4879960.1 sigma-54-dependent Fis family transcriptional regulator [Pseudoalteromonas luteoviolacea]MBQ4908977.1 sigma-54-dependent Fis family transcriptional regulator [Pseudoalteromonas luteoviolacea]
MRKKILVADDDINIFTSVKYLLDDFDYEIQGATTVDGALDLIKHQHFDLVIMDMNFQQDTTSGNEGLQLVKRIRQADTGFDQPIPIIAITGWATVDIAVESLKLGVMDFIQKPWDDQRLLSAIQNQLKFADSQQQAFKLKQENKILHEHAQSNKGIIYQSDIMKDFMETLTNIAQSDMNVLLTGENGTGKSLLAGYIHQHSAREQHSFVSANMGAIQESLFESEMFGHTKGAFTDAKEHRVGRFALADGGTLFLDEIAEIPFKQQSKLLRVIEDKAFEVLGSSRTLTTNVRIICATNCDLKQAIADKTFRQDLYYRINTVELRVPSLRERPEDILLLAEYFLQKNSRKYRRACPVISYDAADMLRQYTWPGNVRQLDHLMEKVMFTCKADIVNWRDLQLEAADKTYNVDGQSETELENEHTLTLIDIERNAILRRLEYYSGNINKTVRSLGLTRSSYYRRVNKLDL